MKNTKYNVLLETLAESIDEKNGKISLMRWQLADLKKQLSDAEAEILQLKAQKNGVLCSKTIERRNGGK